MRATLCLSLVALGQLCAVAMAQEQPVPVISRSSVGSATYITHVTVIDTESGKESPDRTVVISGDRISEIKASKGVKTPSGSKVVDGTGKYLIPGLWDMHVHAWKYAATYPLYIANGVTGIREMFGPPDANSFRRELAAKSILSPHFYLGSPIIDGHPAVHPGSIEVTSIEQAKAVVQEQKRLGADFIKEYSRLSREAYFAIMAESERAGLPAVGHVPLRVTAWEASESKQASFEHLYGIEVACSGRERELQTRVVSATPGRERRAVLIEAIRSYDKTKCDKLFAKLRTNQNWQSPTLTVLRPLPWGNPQLLEDARLRYFSGEFRDWLIGAYRPGLKDWTTADSAMEREQFEFSKRTVGAMFRAKVPLLAGTDTGNPFCFPGFSLHDELALLVESGLTPLAALQAATRNAAIFMNATDRYGLVSKGKVADLVLLDADPLQDIHNTMKISEVFLGGKEFNRTVLDGILKTAETAASVSD